MAKCGACQARKRPYNPAVPQRLLFPKALFAEMLAHVESGLPNEACGLLAGKGEQVEAHYPAENTARSPVRFQMDARQQVLAMLDLEARGLELAAIYHSHPHGPPRPSATDVAEAYYPEAMYMILSSGREGAWEARAFRIVDGEVEEVRVEIGD